MFYRHIDIYIHFSLFSLTLLFGDIVFITLLSLIMCSSSCCVRDRVFLPSCRSLQYIGKIMETQSIQWVYLYLAHHLLSLKKATLACIFFFVIFPSPFSVAVPYSIYYVLLSTTYENDVHNVRYGIIRTDPYYVAFNTETQQQRNASRHGITVSNRQKKLYVYFSPLILLNLRFSTTTLLGCGTGNSFDICPSVFRVTKIITMASMCTKLLTCIILNC